MVCACELGHICGNNMVTNNNVIIIKFTSLNVTLITTRNSFKSEDSGSYVVKFNMSQAILNRPINANQVFHNCLLDEMIFSSVQWNNNKDSEILKVCP